jgi:hypothetical protein
MLLKGLPVRHAPALDELREMWRPLIAAGPSADQHELDMRRYVVTDLLDQHVV